MNQSLKLIAIVSCTLLSFNAMCQISKSDVQQFTSSHAPSSAQKFFVTRQVEYSTSANGFTSNDVVFDAASTSVTLFETVIRIKDGKGMDMMVPYSAIKYLSFQPETDKVYSSICIYLE